jgi:hypothetical protein
MPKSSTFTTASGWPFDAREVDVVGLEVAVDEALGVRFVERAQDLLRDVDRLLDVERALALGLGGEQLALEQLHREVEVAGGVLAEVEHAHGVRVHEQAHRLGLALEAADGLAVRDEVGLEHLQRDRTPEAALLGAVHGAHAARADAADDVVAATHEGVHERIVLERLELLRRDQDGSVLGAGARSLVRVRRRAGRAVTHVRGEARAQGHECPGLRGRRC